MAKTRKEQHGTAAAGGAVQRSASSRVANRKAPTDAFRLPRAKEDGESHLLSVSTTTGKHRVVVVIRFNKVGDKTVPLIGCTGKSCRT